jgi:transcriptional regulator with XRE-family HTH domain
MQTMERDPAYIASQVKLLRKWFQLTQENLADAAGLTTRTIEKVESGRHRPEEQTLRSIARALNMDVRIFEKPTPEQEARFEADMRRAARKTLLVPTQPIHSLSDFLNAFAQRNAFRFDTSQIDDDEAHEIAATMQDWIADLNDVWVECPHSQRVEYARSFVDLCKTLKPQGYVCYIGNHGQKLSSKDKPPLVVDVGVMSIQKADGEAGTRYALIHLEGGWEKLEKDRGAFE